MTCDSSVSEKLTNKFRMCSLFSNSERNGSMGQRTSAIPSFFRGRKYNGRLALRRGESRVTSLEARVRRLQLSERGRAMLNAGPWSCPFAPHEGQKAWKSARSQNEGIPEANSQPVALGERPQAFIR